MNPNTLTTDGLIVIDCSDVQIGNTDIGVPEWSPRDPAMFERVPQVFPTQSDLPWGAA